ncbi:MAG: glycosyltransferase family 2 protein [Thomasclavelia sp.]
MNFINKVWKFICLIGRGIRFFWREYKFIVPFSMWKKYIQDIKSKSKRAVNGLPILDPMKKNEYNEWLSKQKINENIRDLSYRPLISILIPVYNVKKEYLKECIDSVLQQTYTNFEICIVDDASNNEDTIKCLQEFENNDKCKVFWRRENGHISRASNDALKMANGQFIALLDNDDILDKNALYENVVLLNKDDTLDLIYSDEDKIDFDGKYCEPHFKPDFSPDTLLSLNYICHFTVIRKSIIEQVGGFEIGVEGAQDYDVFLKISEITNKIRHISKILYHWRKSETSTANSSEAKDYVINRTIMVLNNALKRRNIDGKAVKDKNSDFYQIKYSYDREPKVSIIIPTKDCADLTENCIKSVYDKTDYQNYEVILVNNNSEKQETFDLFERYQNKYSNFKVIDAKVKFNFSKINNIAIKSTNSDIIVLLNNDTEIISNDWLKEMVGYAIQKHIGAVGVKLLYEDNTIQHGGVLLGLNAIASHAFINESHDSSGLYGRLNVPYNYSAVTAACLAIERKKIEQTGFLDEKLEVAYNDIEYNLRLLKRGFYNVFLPQIEVYHYESKTRGLDTTTEKYNQFQFERDYMLENYGEFINNDPFYNINFSKCDPDANFYLDK